MLSRIVFLIACLCGRVASSLSRILGKGSGEQIQGRVISALSSKALYFAARNKHIVVVSATNGKTTTTRLIAAALEQKHGTVISNALGANQRAGIIAALVNGSKANDTWAVLEVDERSLPGLYDELHPELIVFGNLSRDQLDRFGEVASISQSWKKMLGNTDAHIIANGCDPHIIYATSGVKSIDYVDIFSKWHSDAHTCPECGALLTWDDGHFDCPSCDFATPTTIAIGADIKARISDSLALPGEWNVSNALLAYVAVHHLQVIDEDIFSSWPVINDVSGRNAIFSVQGRSVQLFLAKNPAGWNETLTHISSTSAGATIFAFNCNIADGKDPSWLYDVDFESLTADDIIVFGERATDMIVRLDIAGKATQRTNDITSAIELTPPSCEVNLVASYTQFLSLSRELAKRSDKVAS